MVLMLALATPVAILACTTDPPTGGGDLPGDRGGGVEVDATTTPTDGSTDGDAGAADASAGDADATTDGS